VANLPYAISTPWMDAVLSGPLPARMVLMLQREAADRYGASPGTKSFGAISIFLQAAYDTAPGHRVSAACFHPRPDVDSALLHLVRKPRPHVFAAADKALIRRCFQQRRKQIGAVVREVIPGREREWRELLGSEGLLSTVRAEAIPVSTWIRLVSGAPGAA
jgi:16S rRNA (adenine1518-N6/adenine1519-N6)-dimethyltransferase